MDQIAAYDVVEAGEVQDLVVRVQERIDHGWQPLGGPMFFGGRLVQAIAHPGPAGDEPPAPTGRRDDDLDLLDELTEDDAPTDDWDAELLRR